MFFIPVSVWLYDCGPHSQRASHPRPPDFHADLWGNYRDHPCENFFMISLRKFSENEGEFYMRMFPPPFSVESLGILSKCNLMTREGPQLCGKTQWWFDVIIRWINMFTVLGKLPSHFNRDFKIFPCFFHVDLRFTYNLSFRVDSIPQQTQTLEIPPRNPRDLARWVSCTCMS
mgnify:FL=1